MATNHSTPHHKSVNVDELRGNDTPEVTPDVDNAYTKLDTSDRVLHTTNVPQP
jgi:hypothetical protein